MSPRKEELKNHFDNLAEDRSKYIRRNRYYYDQLLSFLKFVIPEGSSVLEIGSGNGDILAALKPSRGLGIDFSSKMTEVAKELHPELEFICEDAEELTLTEKFDFIVISDTLGYFEDVQKVFHNLKNCSNSKTRLVITYQSFLWEPIIQLTEFLRIKMPQKKLNWLNNSDVANLLYLEDSDIIKSGRKIIFPIGIPLLSNFINTYIGNLPIINSLCLMGFSVARFTHEDRGIESVSVIIPARNEKGNIENALKRLPQMGKHTEVIFVEGNSTDDTLDEIKRVCEAWKDKMDIKRAVQEGKGKGDAVRKGFGMAKGDVLMILDADLTVPPEDLPKFYNAIAENKGEYINGSRLVYPMDDEAMRLLNIFGNKFFSWASTYLLGQRLKDTLCGTKVISKENYNKLIANRGYFGDFDPFGDFDLIFGSAKMNLKIVEVPIRYRAREYGTTNISRFRHGWLLLKMVVFAMRKIKFV